MKTETNIFNNKNIFSVMIGAATWLYNKLIETECVEEIEEILKLLDCLPDDHVDKFPMPDSSESTGHHRESIKRIAYALYHFDECQISEDIYYNILFRIDPKLRFDAMEKFYKLRTFIWDAYETIDINFACRYKSEVNTSEDLILLMKRQDWVHNHFAELCLMPSDCSIMSEKDDEMFNERLFNVSRGILEEIHITDIYGACYGAYLVLKSEDNSKPTIGLIYNIASKLPWKEYFDKVELSLEDCAMDCDEEEEEV